MRRYWILYSRIEHLVKTKDEEEKTSWDETVRDLVRILPGMRKRMKRKTRVNLVSCRSANQQKNTQHSVDSITREVREPLERKYLWHSGIARGRRTLGEDQWGWGLLLST